MAWTFVTVVLALIFDVCNTKKWLLEMANEERLEQYFDVSRLEQGFRFIITAGNRIWLFFLYSQNGFFFLF